MMDPANVSVGDKILILGIVHLKFYDAFLSDLKNEQMELKAQAEENSGRFSLSRATLFEKPLENIKLKT